MMIRCGGIRLALARPAGSTVSSRATTPTATEVVREQDGAAVVQRHVPLKWLFVPRIGNVPELPAGRMRTAGMPELAAHRRPTVPEHVDVDVLAAFETVAQSRRSRMKQARRKQDNECVGRRGQGAQGLIPGTGQRTRSRLWTVLTAPQLALPPPPTTETEEHHQDAGRQWWACLVYLRIESKCYCYCY
jgi:hypothetical protein